MAESVAARKVAAVTGFGGGDLSAVADQSRLVAAMLDAFGRIDDWADRARPARNE